jgi:hypothetical protein
MPAVREIKGRLKVSHFDEAITRMSMDELVAYEAFLWGWMDKADSPAKIARILNMVHREVEWRATDT